MNAMLKEYGIEPDKEQTQQILEKVKHIGDQGKQVTDVELLSIASEILGERGIKRIVQLTGFSVSTGIGTMPYAFVKLNKMVCIFQKCITTKVQEYILQILRYELMTISVVFLG